jgi:hypothetical protein
MLELEILRLLANARISTLSWAHFFKRNAVTNLVLIHTDFCQISYSPRLNSVLETLGLQQAPNRPTLDLQNTEEGFLTGTLLERMQDIRGKLHPNSKTYVDKNEVPIYKAKRQTKTRSI